MIATIVETVRIATVHEGVVFYAVSMQVHHAHNTCSEQASNGQTCLRVQEIEMKISD